MSDHQANPLSEYFRQPVIYISLPSKGKYWPEESIILPANGEIPVLPMTTKDEITLRTPDALMNGVGVVTVLQSCFPNIINAWDMPSIDVDYTLIALRIASYGNNLETEATCPNCNEKNTYELDLNQTLASIKCPDYSKPLTIDGLTIKFKPQRYYGANKANMMKFEEQQLLTALADQDISSEVKALAYSQHFEKLFEIGLDIVGDSIESITTPDGIVVTDVEYIKEFFQNSNRSIVNSIKKWLDEAAEVSTIKPVKVTCNNCTNEFEVQLTFDYSSFFA